MNDCTPPPQATSADIKERASRLACPACGKRQTTVGRPPACPRCAADLSDALRSRAAAAHLALQGRRALPDQPKQALRCCLAAYTLQPSPDLARDIACAHLLLRHYDEAVRWRAKQ